ncbi:MAG: DUF3536 domain-containing protein [Myxococcales bacterium]|nr:DUF3536 domain-containing protein [Myxococcales bacterium]
MWTECYQPLTAAKVLGEWAELRHVKDVYSRVSFDMGGRVLGWLSRAHPSTYHTIVSAGARGASVAHPYVHAILPLANPRDLRTLVRWGVADFRHHYGRQPRSMWLPETAVDLSTLEVLAEEGTSYVILSPSQARTAAGASPSPGVAHRLALPSGRSLAAFFTDPTLDAAVAYEGLLHDGDQLADRLLGAATTEGGLVQLATDGASFGHHHRHGEMALAWAIDRIDEAEGVSLVHPERYLELHPPSDQVQLLEETSSGCPHGLSRWRAACACGATAQAKDMRWRGHLRRGLDALSERLAEVFDEHGRSIVSDPWAARDAYISVLLAPSRRARFAREVGCRPEDERTLWRLLAMQHHGLEMFASDGWSFEDVTRPETVRVMQHAARAMELAEEVAGVDLRPTLREHMDQVIGNTPEAPSGRDAWRRHVLRGRVTTEDVARVAVRAAVTGREAARMPRFDAWVSDGAVVVLDRDGGAEVRYRFDVAGSSVAPCISVSPERDQEPQQTRGAQGPLAPVG